jgi:hypothetical protein
MPQQITLKMNKAIRENVRYSPSKLVDNSVGYSILDNIDSSVEYEAWTDAGKYIRNTVWDTLKWSIEIPIANSVINYFHQKWIIK